MNLDDESTWTFLGAVWCGVKCAVQYATIGLLGFLAVLCAVMATSCSLYIVDADRGATVTIEKEIARSAGEGADLDVDLPVMK